MYDYNYGSGMTSQNEVLGILGALGAIMGVISIVSGIIGLIMLISNWKIYKKAGKPGWASIIPIYNIVVLLQIVELPLWYIVLLIVPFANVYAMFKIYIELAHKFGKSTGFGVASVFFGIICLPILAFGKNNVYVGNNTNQTQLNNMQPTQNTSNFNDINNQNNGGQFPSSTPARAAMFEQNINTQITSMAQNNVQPQQENNMIQTPQDAEPAPVMATPQPTPVQNIMPMNNNVNTVPATEPTPFVYNPNPAPVEQPMAQPTMNTMPQNNIEPNNIMQNVQPTGQIPQQPVQNGNFNNPQM